MVRMWGRLGRGQRTIRGGRQSRARSVSSERTPPGPATEAAEASLWQLAVEAGARHGRALPGLVADLRRRAGHCSGGLGRSGAMGRPGGGSSSASASAMLAAIPERNCRRSSIAMVSTVAAGTSSGCTNQASAANAK
jgi:hypothetical protein